MKPVFNTLFLKTFKTANDISQEVVQGWQGLRHIFPFLCHLLLHLLNDISQEVIQGWQGLRHIFPFLCHLLLRVLFQVFCSPSA